MGSGQGKAAAADRRKPTDNISARSVSDAQGYATQGQTLAKSGKNEEALAEFERALALDPYNVRALYGRGLIYQAEKQHQQAIEDFTAANGLSPQKAEPLLARANSYFALDKIKEAMADLDEAVQADPNSALAWSSRGAAYERLGDKAKAHRPPTAARSSSAPRTKPREAASHGPAGRLIKRTYFGRTAWNSDFAADSISSAAACVCSRTVGSGASARRSSGRETGISAGGVGRLGSAAPALAA